MRQWLCGLAITCGLSECAVAVELRAVMLTEAQVTAHELQTLMDAGCNAVVLQLEGQSDSERQREAEAAQRIGQSDLDLYFWIEIAHCPELADKHPEWMASLQGHQEWRRLFPDVPQPKTDVEVVKNYPWVPILSKEAFEAHVLRVRQLLRGKPQAKGILLNDLQGAPSACGCGNPLCRWTADYGPIKTATTLKADAAARFVEAVAEIAPESGIIPVWLTECEEHDGDKDGLCAGVGCFRGICWKAWTQQLVPVAKRSPQIAAMVTFRALGRDIPLYGGRAAWVGQALASFQSVPLQNNESPIPAQRLIAMIQGWDVSEADIAAQRLQVKNAGAYGYVLMRTQVDQSWHPRIHQLAR